MNEQKTQTSSRQRSLKEQRERRRRINRIKTGIIIFFVGWMTLCMVMNIYLMIRVCSLQKQVDVIVENTLNNAPVSLDELEEEQSPEETLPEEPKDQSDDEKPQEENEEGGETLAKVNVRDCIPVSENILSDGEQMTVYLTFDDGPSDNTQEILNILQAHDVKATFFVTGKEGEEAKERYRAIVDQGHTLAMHSYTHKYSEIYESLDSFQADFTKLRNYLKKVTGVKPSVYRFPGGSSNQVSNTDMNVFVDYLGEQGVVYYDWNVACGDATSQIYTAEELADNVMKDVVKYKYSVVLLHDSSDKDSTVEALEIMLQRLEEMNAKILPITDESPVIHHTIKAQ